MKIKEIVLFAILGAIMFSLKIVMAGLPNIEPVTPLIIVFSTVYGRKSFYPILVYVILELLIYGLGLWSIGYCYIWLIIAIVSYLSLSKTGKIFVAACIAFVFGLLFGALYIPIYVVASGANAAMIWWIAGIPYDIVHGISNFVITIVVYKPLIKLLKMLNSKLKI